MIRGAGGAKAELAYALAFLGAHLSFMPLFTLLLPRRVEAIDPASPVQSLSLLLLVGGVTASLAHIAAGRWSDRWLVARGNRRALIGIGLALLLMALLALAVATSMTMLMATIIAFQVTLNLMFAPLGALLADHVPDARKGRVAGWLNASLPLSNAGTFLAAALFPRDGTGGFLVVIALVAITILPLVAFWPFGRVIDHASESAPQQLAQQARRDFVRIWLARLAIQIGAAFIISYFYLYLGSRFGSAAASDRMARLAMLATIAAFVSAIAAGHWTDARQRRRPPMIVAAAGTVLGLALLATDPGWPLLIAGYIAFHAGLTAFLSVDYAMVSQLIGPSERRGELLGYMNLTNTLPAIIVPALGLAAGDQATLVPWPLLFALAALLSLAAALLVARVRSVA